MTYVVEPKFSPKSRHDDKTPRAQMPSSVRANFRCAYVRPLSALPSYFRLGTDAARTSTTLYLVFTFGRKTGRRPGLGFGRVARRDGRRLAAVL